MALESNNFYNAVRGAMGLFGKTNKAAAPLDEDDGQEQAPQPEFGASLSDEDILALTAKWTSDDAAYQKDIRQQQKDNVNYWAGKQHNELQTAGTRKPLVDNLVFEAVETFLPIATRGNPQAIVTGDGTPAGDKVAKTVQRALEHQADRQHLRMRLKGVTRNWALYLVGCAKVGWDSRAGDVETTVVLPTRLVFDPNAFVDVGGLYRGEYLGERKKATASRLARMFPAKKAAIQAAAQGAMGTSLTYVEWWTPEHVFFTFGDSVVLGKYKNPHWNYTGEVDVADPVTGAISREEVEGINHFAAPAIPYVFLSIFSLGKRPHDEANLIQQNIPIQDSINKRYQQIDRNVDAQNNGVVLSGKSFTKEQAAEAATQLARGNPLWVPDGKIGESYVRDSAPSLSPNVFQQLTDARNELRNIFGTSGSSAQSLNEQKTVRGKIMVNQMDSSRIGGGVTEFIEGVAQSLYDWYVQMMYVYYTQPHSFTVAGAKANERLSLSNEDLNVRLTVTVKDGSLVPKDPLTKRNEAMDLWSAGAIAPVPFYEALDVPNPYESAKELMLWQLIQKGAVPPQAMFPDLEAAPPAPVPTGADQTNAVSAQESARQVQTPMPDTVGETSQKLLASVPL